MAKEKPPILGRLQRGGAGGIRRLDNVQPATMAPLIRAPIAVGTQVYTDEDAIQARWRAWGHGHSPVCHGRGEYARDEDGEGLHEVHVNTLEGVWSLLRSWLRPHRGLSQEKLPLYLGCFQFVHNARIQGQGLLKPLLGVLLA